VPLLAFPVKNIAGTSYTQKVFPLSVFYFSKIAQPYQAFFKILIGCFIFANYEIIVMNGKKI
jgi:hypothetical protein